LTPLATPGATFEPLVTHTGPNPDYVADGAAAIAVSPDGHEMLVLTSGFNRFIGADAKPVAAQSGQYIFVYAIGAAGAQHKQTLEVPNSFSGIAYAPDGQHFYVGGGVDDTVIAFARGAAGFAPDGAPIKLGHKAGNGNDVQPQAAGVAVSPDGKRLLVANYYNDSVSLIDTQTRTVIAEQDLRPGKINSNNAGVAGGEFPFSVVWVDNDHAYVSAPRDRELDYLLIFNASVNVVDRIRTIGEPTALYFDARQQRLYATEDNDDRIAMIDTRHAVLNGEPRLGFPAGFLDRPLGKGLNPNSIARGPGGTLLVTDGGINALALVRPRGDAADVIGLVPTGWYPSAAAVSADGKRLFVVNRKSPPGPNPKGCGPRKASIKGQSDACGSANQYIYQLEKAGLLTLNTPSLRTLLASTRQVAANIGLNDAAARRRAEAIMARVRAKIRHVIFIVKENRTYDQVLGDLDVGNGDPKLTMFGEAIAPNHHQLARQFVTLD
ncbi:MAG: beta-propeller fold lactonase family protein, partial [Alphaproteobacteria bacterium]|nr:beta-propeller fold lactonase family protein [Alphaproteobacteria bacterium]